MCRCYIFSRTLTTLRSVIAIAIPSVCYLSLMLVQGVKLFMIFLHDMVPRHSETHTKI